MNKYKIIETGEVVDAVRLTKTQSVPTGTGELAGEEGSWVITNADGDKSVVSNELFLHDLVAAGNATNAVQYKNIFTGEVVDAVQAGKERNVPIGALLAPVGVLTAPEAETFVLNRGDWLITQGKVQFPLSDADFHRLYAKVEPKPEAPEKHVFKPDVTPVKNHIEQYDKNGDLIK